MVSQLSVRQELERLEFHDSVFRCICIYLLGDPQLRDTPGRGCFAAYELLSEASRDASTFLEFALDHREGVRSLLTPLLDASPIGRLLFTSDWQFGPSEARRFDAISLPEYWRLHDARGLRLNAAYPINGAA